MKTPVRLAAGAAAGITRDIVDLEYFLLQDRSTAAAIRSLIQKDGQP